MFLKKEKFRQILFLFLIIGCTIMVYTTWYINNEKRNDEETTYAEEIESHGLLKTESDAKTLFSNFIKKPNSREGVNSLFDAVVKWELNGRKDSVQNAIKEFEITVKSKSLKNSFYNRLGKFYSNSYKRLSFSSTSIKKINNQLNSGKS